MNALIIAAGRGSRLGTPSKPLTLVAGIPLIEHVVSRALAGGASAFTVVTGHEAEHVEVFLVDLARRLGVEIRTVRTPDTARPNGLSVITGAATIEGDFLLLMSDHLFDPAVVRGLIAHDLSPVDLVLAVDRRLDNPLIDPDDATRVRTDRDGRIVAIGKGLDQFDATDIGLFRATGALSAAISASIEAGASGSLSDGVQQLANQGRATTMDVGDAWWIDVDGPTDLAAAERALTDRGS